VGGVFLRPPKFFPPRHPRGFPLSILPKGPNFRALFFGEREMLLIVDKFVGELGKQLGERNVTVTLSPAARQLLAKKGHDPMNGARPLSQGHAGRGEAALTDELLFGALLQAAV